MSEGHVNELMEILSVYFEAHNDSPPFDGHRDLLATIDGIKLGGVEWESFTGRYTGTLPASGPIPEWMTTDFEVFYRDPHEVVRNMLANPDFDGEFDYTPYQEFENERRRWSDFMSGNWAWRQAVSWLPDYILALTNVLHPLGYHWRRWINTRIHVRPDHPGE